MKSQNDRGNLSSAASPTEPGRPSVVHAPAQSPDPLLPEQSREDTDAAWGDYRDDDGDRLYRDRPPHWEDC